MFPDVFAATEMIEIPNMDMAYNSKVAIQEQLEQTQALIKAGKYENASEALARIRINSVPSSGLTLSYIQYMSLFHKQYVFEGYKRMKEEMDKHREITAKLAEENLKIA